MTPGEFLKERLLVVPTCLFTGKCYETITLTSIMQDYAKHYAEQKLNIANVSGQLVCDNCGKDKPEDSDFCDCHGGEIWELRQTNYS